MPGGQFVGGLQLLSFGDLKFHGEILSLTLRVENCKKTEGS